MLKPCPFCGNKNLGDNLEDIMFNPPGQFFIECFECGLLMENYNKQLLIEKWNTRYESKD